MSDLLSRNGLFVDGDWVESKDQDPKGDVRLIQLADIGDGRYINKSNRFLTTSKAQQLGCTFLEPSDLLIARMPDPLGRACLFPGDAKVSVTVVDVCVIRTANEISHRWLMYTINAPAFRNSISALQSGSTRKRISRKNLSTITLPVPPLVEQRATVEKIEALLSELDKGVEQLQAVRAQLKRYRQAMLKAAFEGKLTADWRAQQQQNLPTATNLLEQIKAEREARYQQQFEQWQQAVADWEAAGGKASGQKKPRKPAKPKDLPPLISDELAGLPDLPEGWTWAKVEAMGDVQLGRQRSPKHVSKEYPTKYIRAANITESGIQLSDVLEMEFAPAERERYELRKGDLVLSEASGSPDQVGKPACWNDELPVCCFQNTVIRLRPTVPISQYLLWLFRYFYWCGVFVRVAGGVGINHLSASKFAALPVAIAPEPEQTAIVNELESRFSVLDKLEQTVDAGLEQAEALRQSILKKAFEGRLLSEAELVAIRAHPGYEPADQLLERIRADREQVGQTKATPSRKRKPAQTTRRLKLPTGERYRQAAFAAYAVNRLADRPTFGRTQLMKFLYLVPHVLEQASHIYAQREAAGPWDPAIYKIEGLAKASRQRWFTVRQVGHRYAYRRGDNMDAANRFAVDKMGAARVRVDWLLDQFAKWDTEQAELVATVFAVWNDHLIDGHQPTDDEIVEGVHDWHPEKAKFEAARIRRCIGWMRNVNLVPLGIGSRCEPIGGAA
ncbi:MAG: restriction endonuclease subunit S [Phycisphaeraceae bacterium]